MGEPSRHTICDVGKKSEHMKGLGDISQHRYMNIKKVIDVWVSQVGIQWVMANEGKQARKPRSYASPKL